MKSNANHSDLFASSGKQPVLLCRIVLIAGMLIFYLSIQAQQEAMYSQYMFNMLHLNPAYAGNRQVDNITLLYRQQWLGVDRAPQTGTLSWDRRSENSNGGYGVTLYNDIIGIESTTGMQLFYAYHIPFENASLSLGISGGILNYRAALTKDRTIAANDPVFAQDENAWLPTAGVGLLYSAEHWYLGFSVPALMRTKTNSAVYINEKDLGANNHYFFTGGYIYSYSDMITIKSSILIKAVVGAPLACDMNLNAWFNNTLSVGAGYRVGEGVLGMVEIQILPQLRIGYAYDYATSSLGQFSNGTHELMLRYEFSANAKNDKILSPRYY
jgi:type IX secretion system PorP/SprF family membrane protein